MASAADINEPYSISDARTGSIRVSRLVLSGLAATPSATAGFKAWSDQGRMWGVFTYVSANSGDFSLRRRGPGLYAATDEVCSGTVADGKVTLAADNTSGITGTADVDDGTPGTNPQADATFDVIVGYADENDLAAGMAQAAKMLNSSAYPGGGASTRFERLLLDSKGMLDDWLETNYHDVLRYDAYGRPMLCDIVRPGKLARCQALIALHMWNLHRAGMQPESPAALLAEQMLESARFVFKNTPVAFDYGRDLSVDRREQGNVVKVRRA